MNQPAQTLEICVGARTDVGSVREHNEDSYCLADLTSGSRDVVPDPFPVGPHGVLLAVCDGMGGAAGGEIASKMAADVLSEDLVRGRGESTKTSWSQLGRRLVAAVHRASEMINDEALRTPERRGMGTTLTAAGVVDDCVVVAQVGDSRAYILRRGELTQITRDQSLVEKLLEAGAITPEEAATFEHGNVILQALGALRETVVEVSVVRLVPGDRVLLCSDGLCGVISNDEIASELGGSPESPTAICDRLVARALEAGGYDNVTAIVMVVAGEQRRSSPPVVILGEGGREGPRDPIPDPRNLLAAYAPGFASGASHRDFVAVAVDAEPASSGRPIALPAPPILPAGVSSPPSASVTRPPAASTMSVAPRQADVRTPRRAMYALIGGAVAVSLAVAAVTTWTTLRRGPTEAVGARRDSGEKTWVAVTTTSGPAARATVATATSALSVVPPAGAVAPVPSGDRAAVAGRGASPATDRPPAAHPATTASAPKSDAPIPIEDYP